MTDFSAALLGDRPTVNEHLEGRDGLLSADRITYGDRRGGNFRPIRRRKDGHHRRELLPHRDRRRLAARLLVGQANGLGFVHGDEHPVDHIRAEVGGAKPGDGEKVRGLIRAVVHVPADEVLAPGGGVVVPRGGPKDPALAVRMGEKGQDFLAVRESIPSDSPVAEGCHGNLPVGVDSPYNAGHSDPPQHRSGGIEQPEAIGGTEKKPRQVRFDGQTFRHLLLQLQGTALQLGGEGGFPVADPQTFGNGCLKGEVRLQAGPEAGGDVRELPLVHREERGRSSAALICKLDGRAVRGEEKPFFVGGVNGNGLGAQEDRLVPVVDHPEGPVTGSIDNPARFERQDAVNGQVHPQGKVAVPVHAPRRPTCGSGGLSSAGSPRPRREIDHRMTRPPP